MEDLGRKAKRSKSSLTKIWKIIRYDVLELYKREKRRGLTPQRMIFLAFLCIYVVIGYFPKTIKGFSYITGDEPHYLVMIQSIANDRDFHLDNNYQPDLHKEFYNAPLDRHYIDIHGKSYSLHQFGLPLLMAPFYKLFGYKGVFLSIILFSCFGLVSVYNMCVFFSNPRSAFSATFLLGLTVPVGIYLSSQLFPETMAFSLFASLISIVLNLDFKHSKFSFVLVLFISITLSLLHVKFISLIFGACLLSIFLSIERRQIKYAFMFWILIAVMTTTIVYVVLSIMYEGKVLGALYKLTHPAGDISAPSMNTKYIIRGMYLNFFEREKGIFWYMPVLFIFLNPLYIYNLFGYIWRNCKIQFLGTFLSNMPYLAAVFSFFDSLGGWCPPGRYLMPSMTFVAILLSLSMDMMPKWLLKISVFITFICILHPGIMYADAHNSFAVTRIYNAMSDLIISEKMTNYATTVDTLAKVKFVGLLLGGMFAVISYEMIIKIFVGIGIKTDNA
jgi:hypothetical protein